MSTGIGDALREARTAQGRTLEEVARAVRARSGQLQALEEERFDSFGGEIYAKGFLKSYAVELGLDPDPLLATFRREIGDEFGSVSSNMVVPVRTTGGPRRTTPPAWAAWVLVGLVVVAGIVFLGMMNSSTPDTADDGVVGTPPTSAPGGGTQDEDEDDQNEDTDDGNTGEGEGTEAPQEQDGASAGGEDEQDGPDETFDGVEVILALEDESWMRVTVDGAVLLEQVVEAGETQRYEADGEIVVRIGNAGGVRAQYNGEDLGPTGSSGEVVELRFTPDGYEPV